MNPKSKYELQYPEGRPLSFIELPITLSVSMEVRHRLSNRQHRMIVRALERLNYVVEVIDTELRDGTSK